MTDVFEQPWLLLIVAAVAFCITFFLRDRFPTKNKWLFLTSPIFLAILALALDLLIQTDNEKVLSVIKKSVKAVEKEDVKALAPLISEDYRDSFNQSKRALLWRCRQHLSEPIIEKNVMRIVSLKVQDKNAEAVFTVRAVFDPKGPVYNSVQMMVFKFIADFEKKRDNWYFSRVELLEIDMHPADWQHITGFDGLY